MQNELTISLLSGLVGSFLTVLTTAVIAFFRHRSERKNLYCAIASECRYNLSILDEVTDGTVNHQGSFKRMSVEFFKTVRQQSMSYALPAKLLSYLSRVIVDLELFNMEVGFVFNKNIKESLFIGNFKEEPICVVQKTMLHDIHATVKAANIGVRDSLNVVLEFVLNELGVEDEE